MSQPFFSTLMRGIMAGIAAFRETFTSSDTLDETNFSAFDSRRLRYQIYWAFYENTVYRDMVHKWSRDYRAQYGLYKYIRNLYNPTFRLGEFWKAHLWGGGLDVEAGDGKTNPSALPIKTDNEQLRKAIARVWRWSNWQINKDITTLYGSVMGDVGIRVIDLPDKERVYLSLVHPGTLKALDKDTQGNVKGYTIEYERPDPRQQTAGRIPQNPKFVVYSELCTRKPGDDNVYYQTLMDGKPWAWAGDTDSWSVEYGFVPLVVIQHNNIGLEWGWSELHAMRSKFHEVDDLGSKLSDQIRKMVDAPWFFSGMSKPKDDPRTKGAARTPEKPEPGKDEMQALYGPQGSSATPMIANLDVAATTNYIASLLKEIERDYPELAADINNLEGEISGRALRIRQQPAANKVEQRRAAYDDALVRAQQMAVAIGGLRGYADFRGFGLESFDAGDLDHSIGQRPVFQKDPLDDLEVENSYWTTAGLAKTAGCGLVTFMKRNGASDEQIAEVEKDPEYKARLEALANVSAMNADGAGDGKGKPFGGKSPLDQKKLTDGQPGSGPDKQAEGKDNAKPA